MMLMHCKIVPNEAALAPAVLKKSLKFVSGGIRHFSLKIQLESWSQTCDFPLSVTNQEAKMRSPLNCGY